MFTTELSPEDPDKCDHIYRLQKTGQTFQCVSLYDGNLHFDANNPIECLGVYENEKIQKVYWTDGSNQPRFINIIDQPADGVYNDTSFDFIPTLELNDSIHIQKVPDSSGLFPAGVIQYAVTYYNKYGQESNISVVSPLIPTSYTQRAGSPEETIGNAFKVTIKNPDMHFEYMRIYSIFRSSKDTTPVCKRVADVRLGDGSATPYLYTSNDVSEITYARIDDTIDDSIEILFDPKGNYTPIDRVNVGKHTGPFTTPLTELSIGEGVTYYHFTKAEHPHLIIKVRIA